MVTADGIAEGVPSVVSEAIDWAPRSWKAPVDDANAMARIGRKLLQPLCRGQRHGGSPHSQPFCDARVARVSVSARLGGTDIFPDRPVAAPRAAIDGTSVKEKDEIKMTSNFWKEMESLAASSVETAAQALLSAYLNKSTGVPGSACHYSEQHWTHCGYRCGRDRASADRRGAEYRFCVRHGTRGFGCCANRFRAGCSTSRRAGCACSCRPGRRQLSVQQDQVKIHDIRSR